MLRVSILAAILAVATGCESETAQIPVVTNFSVERYLGKWYEIARLPHSFEAGLDAVSAEYTKNPNGNIQVLNRGFHTKDAQWRSVKGKAKLAGNAQAGHLRVSFFGPFYADYKVIKLDPEYRYAVVTSSRMNYLWILSRTPSMEKSLLNDLVRWSKEQGFSVDQLIYPDHSSHRDHP